MAEERSAAQPHDVAVGLGQLIEGHLRSAGRGLELCGSTYPAWHWADVDAALDGLDEGQTVCGADPGRRGGLAELLADRSEVCRPGPVQRSAFPVGPDEVRWVATNALRLVRVGGDPVVVLAYGTHDRAAHGGASRGEFWGAWSGEIGDAARSGISDGSAAHHVPRGEPGVRVDVLAEDPAAARSVLGRIDAAVAADSSLRGRVVSFRTPHTDPAPHTARPSRPSAAAFPLPHPAIDVHERPGLHADDVVLPTGCLSRVEAAVLGVSRRAAELRAAGQHLPRVVLLHGPPDSGKTHTVRYLLSQSPDTTAFILPSAVLRDMTAGDLQQGRPAGLIREVLATARRLTPAIVVLEDVDLIDVGDPAVLDALDELQDDEDADLTVILTTHRMGAIEQALALRPGLIDVALEIPLPDVDRRERLFARSARALPVSSTGVRTAAEAAVATPGSFPRQAVRRAVIDALSADTEVDAAHLVSAVRALMAERARMADGGRMAERAPIADGTPVAERAEPRAATSQVTAGDHRSSIKGTVVSEPGAAGSGLRELSEHGLGDGEGFDDDGDGLDDGLGGGEGLGDDGLGGSDGLDPGGHDVEVIDDLDDGLSGEDLLDLELDDEH
ncbi:ATPase family associated with various cellular activities (AAA) [Brevibacterium jeotgali]|uniref:ATPase family associated with various cellular activities (AAA) n=1 Tax=Brevibacterium jeotgali TaxID=1262550 RepID=A0A2H1L7U8_9MICO|nr:ATPase family protein associated with various cellular activities (AAA) [Brevibacterium jeotgali]SMY12984.1 ATPase family associated with various cellular activities (AAA) [Brevibacterium jeotgali]